MTGPATPSPAPRLESLDALRGFTMFWIVGADALAGAFRGLDGGAAAAFLGRQLGHAEWVGFTFYDLLFPLFLFMVGGAVPLSLDGLAARAGRAAALRRVLRRGVLLYALGLLYYGGLAEGWAQLRWVGVLQRRAVAYGAVSLLHLWLRPRASAAVGAGLLLGYWALLTFVPVPGFGAGDYARGHNLANWIDARWLPGKVWYGDYDPEGLLSTLPALASAVLGLFAGRLLQDPRRGTAERTRLLVLGGVALLATGYLWGLQFPLIKRLWTSSYALVAGGWSLLLLAAFHAVIDGRGWRGWARPFVWIGSNALTIYLVSQWVDFERLSSSLVGGEVAAGLDALWAGLGGVVAALTGIGLSTALCGLLHARKVFLRL